MKVATVSLEPKKTEPGDDFSKEILSICSFCERKFIFPEITRNACEKLSKPSTFYCPFCLRNGFQHKTSKNVLVLSFRSVIAYYYHVFYRKPKKVMYLCQMEDYIASHADAGLFNPVFNYDPASFLWFIDFEKVGKNRRRIPLWEVNQTVVNILACFNLWETVPNLQMDKFYAKFEEAISTFYDKRSRPEGRRILCPTFANCGVQDIREMPFDRMREFTPYDMQTY